MFKYTLSKWVGEVLKEGGKMKITKSLIEDVLSAQTEFLDGMYETGLTTDDISRKDLIEGILEILTKENDIPKFSVTCICNTVVEVEENSVGECPNCHRKIDDRGVMC